MNTDTARHVARNLMIIHGVAGWELRFVNSMSYAGLCQQSTRTISLTVEFVQAYDLQQLRQVILHEIAHAKRGRTPDAHDDQWLRIARRIGYTGGEVLPAHYPKPQIRWDVVCPSTGLIMQTSIKPDDTKSCKLCKDPECFPITQRRQIVRADLYNIQPPEHVVAPLLRSLKTLFQRRQSAL